MKLFNKKLLREVNLLEFYLQDSYRKKTAL